MLQRLRAARKNENGFTLTELLIVVVILGVLAAIVVFAVAGITDRGVDAACDADKRTVQTAVEAYHAQTGGYPTGNVFQKLIEAQLLREAPNSPKYTISVVDGAAATDPGKVTGTKTGGGTC